VNEIEASFIRAIQRDPEDDDARMVYADWLEQQGDLRGEYLRLEVQLRRIPPRLAELVRRISPSWLTQVGLRYRVVLIESPNAIATIKLIRGITQLGLKDAKDLFDASRATGRAVIRDGLDPDAAQSIAAAFEGVATVRIESHLSEPSPGTPDTPPTLSLVLVSVARERRIEAIKLVRELTGWGLAEAKNLIDEVHAGNPSALRLEADDSTASTLVARFQGIAEVRVERTPM
jgi:uncharacterized protein (TIGR02996 family)